MSDNPFLDQDAAEGYAAGPGYAGMTSEQLRQREIELERRERELQIREQQLEYKERKVTDLQVELEGLDKPPNWPPFRPLIYHDIRADIPENGRNLVKRVYFSWFISIWCFFFNMVGTLAIVIVGPGGGADFGIGLTLMLVGIPVSFVFWYRPLYSGVKRSRTISYLFFFFNYSCHICLCVVLAIGIPSSGGAGFINGIKLLNVNTMAGTGSVGAGVIVIISGGFWALTAVFCVWQMKGAIQHYRSSGKDVANIGKDAANEAVHSEAGQAAMREAGKAAGKAAVSAAASQQQHA